jgi:Cas7 group CRISPR-associated protein Csh2
MTPEEAKEKRFSEKEINEFKANAIKTGVVHFGLGLSTAPIDVRRLTNTNKAGVEEGKDRGMAPMGYRIVHHGVYCMPFFVNPSMAHKTGCTKEDIDLLLQLIPLAYPHTRSYVRPMVEIRHAWYIEHKSPLGSCSDFALLDALNPKKKTDPNKPSESWDDYEVPISLTPLLQSKVHPLKDLMS